MVNNENSNYFNYYQNLNKAIIRNKIFHLLINILDELNTFLKILLIYQTNYNTINDSPIKYIRLVSFFSNCPLIFKLLPLIIYIIIVTIILFHYSYSRIGKIVKKLDIIIINFFEFFFIRFLFIFYLEFLFSLSSLYFLLFFILSIPFLVFTFIDINIFHISGFMLEIIDFPFDDFTSLYDIQKMIIKILLSIGGVSKSKILCELMFYLQFLFLVAFLIYDSYIIFYKCYYLMNNELIAKTKYSNILSLVIVQIFMLFMKPEEIFERSFIIIFISIIIFTTLFIFLFYNPYKYIIIDTPNNKENLFYYFFVIDRNKNVACFLEQKIQEHIYKCNHCSLCSKYQEYLNSNNNFVLNEEKNKEKDLFTILYNGDDKSLLLFNNIIKDIKKLGIKCLHNNSYYLINSIYIFHYSMLVRETSFSLNQLFIFNLIQENNLTLISSHKPSIKQIMNINEFLILYKIIIEQIKEIISKNNAKKYIDNFFELANNLTSLDHSKFKESLYRAKEEGVTNYTYLVSICSLLYEEIFNKTLSTYAIPIRENGQLHEDILKQFYKQNNNIILKLNLKTIECKIIYAAKELFDFANSNFYDLFPHQLKEVLIKNFCDIILNSKESKLTRQNNKNSKKNKKTYIEPTLLIKNVIGNVNYYRTLNLKLSLLLNDFITENVLLNGYFLLNENILVTFKTDKKEKIIGYGNSIIKDLALKSKLSFKKFKESISFQNKSIQFSYSFSLNNYIFNIYNLIHIRHKKRKTKEKQAGKFLSKNNEVSKFSNKLSFVSNMNENNCSKLGETDMEGTENNDISSYNKKVNNIFEETGSQSSVSTNTSGNSFWKLNKTMIRNDQNNFSSKRFVNLEIILFGLLVVLLILMIVLIIQLKVSKNNISTYSDNYFEVRQFLRTFQQFTFTFLSLACIVKDENGDCQEYISSLNNEEFNQTLFLTEQNIILAESCSSSVAKIIKNSEIINDNELIELFKGNISYYLMNIKKVNDDYNISNSIMSISLSDAILLLSNNMRIIVSKESKLKTRDKEPIYLLSGIENPFNNIKNKSDEFSDYQISIYTYLINYRSYVQRFSKLSERLNELIIERNQNLINIFNIFHNLIFLVIILQIVIIVLFLFTFNNILAKIINSIILKFDIFYENDFKKFFKKKIDELESVVTVYSNNPINYMKDINKNSIKYRNILNLKKKSEQRLNMNKKVNEEEDESLLFKNKQKFINWIDIYNKSYDRFYIYFIIIIAFFDVMIYGIIYGIWADYQFKSKATFELIYYSWIFEHNTLRITNFYQMMIFINQTLEDITRDYFSNNDYNCIENINQILYSYYQIEKKRKKISNIYKSFDYFSDYNCKSIYDLMNNIDTNSFSQTIEIMKNKYNRDPQKLLGKFVNLCENTQSFIGNSPSPCFQSLYQKFIDSMILFNNRSYEAIIDKIFNSSLPRMASVFLNLTRYIIYIAGKLTYTNANSRILEILGNYIIITLILYIIFECVHFIFFFFVYIRKMKNQCKNMFILKRVFEVTNPIES